MNRFAAPLLLGLLLLSGVGAPAPQPESSRSPSRSGAAKRFIYAASFRYCLSNV